MVDVPQKKCGFGCKITLQTNGNLNRFEVVLFGRFVILLVVVYSRRSVAKFCFILLTCIGVKLFVVEDGQCFLILTSVG